MPSITTPAYQVVAPENLLALAHFCDEQGYALSFYFCPPGTSDNAHRAEIVVVKGLIQQIQDNFAPQRVSTALAKDLKDVLAIAQGISIVRQASK